MANNKLVSPFLKWVGGKRQLIPEIKRLMPKLNSRTTYIEPFIGGGAVFFELQRKTAIINDYNEELINVYNVIKNNSNELIEILETYPNEEDFFYDIRNADRLEEYNDWDDIRKASRIIYLNKTCYNGLYRVNNSGEFNTPFGKYKNPNIVNKPIIKAVSEYLNNNNIEILSGDYKQVSNFINNKNTFIYLDPPYHPISETSNFTGYVKGGWDENMQLDLRNFCNELNDLGVNFMVSNSSSEYIKEIYKGYKITNVQAKRNINSVANLRGDVNEFIITNY